MNCIDHFGVSRKDALCFTSIKGNLHDERILYMLSLSAYMPTEEMMNRRADEYERDANISVFGCFERKTVSGVIAGKWIDESVGEIIGIAVDPACRGKGIGAGLIAHAATQLKCRQLRAETDDDAVAFYRKCGFAIESLGEKYPGVVRYLCVLKIHEQK